MSQDVFKWVFKLGHHPFLVANFLHFLLRFFAVLVLLVTIFAHPAIVLSLSLLLLQTRVLQALLLLEL